MTDNPAQKLLEGSQIALGSDRRPTSVILSVRALSHAFSSPELGTLRVLETINAEISAGQTVAIVGASGSGKTTFLNLVAGRLSPTEGEIQFEEAAGSHAPGHVGIVFQQPSLLPWRTIRENVALPLELTRQFAGASDIAQSLLISVGLSGFEGYLPSGISGGMQSRAALARSLVTSPTLLLMDEPFGALDEITAEALNLYLSRILFERGITTLLVTHQLAQAVFLADRVWVFGKRPATIVGDIAINEPKPRSLKFIDSQQFTDAVRQIRSLLRSS